MRISEKHPCREALSHLPQLSVSIGFLPILLFVLTQTSRQGAETKEGALVPSRRGFFIEENMAMTYKEKKKKTRQGGLIPLP